MKRLFLAILALPITLALGCGHKESQPAKAGPEPMVAPIAEPAPAPVEPPAPAAEEKPIPPPPPPAPPPPPRSTKGSRK